MSIGADLRQPLFVGMRASFVPDTLTFSRKHSCLHSCSLGRDTHYSPLPRRPPHVPPSLPAGAPSLHVPLAILRPSTAGCRTSSLECTYTHVRACTRAFGSACVHIPGETLKCVAERANTHACPSRVEEVVDSLPFLLSFLTSVPPGRPSLARVRTLRDVRVCQWNIL